MSETTINKPLRTEVIQSWGNFRKLRQDQNLILLYEFDRLYRMIPKRCLTQAQLADFQTCVSLVLQP